MRIKKIISAACIVVGIAVMAYPTVNDRYESYKQQQILEQWQESLQYLDQAGSDPEPEQEPVTVSLPAPVPLSTDMVEVQPAPLKAEPTPVPLSIGQKNVEGVLKIDKIDLKLPIIKNATAANLKLSVASMANTGKPGEIGNYAIAGHRNLTYGKNFNRLDEVTEGDLIEVDTGSKQYRYKVESKQYVLPEEVWVLKGNGKDRQITLITCHPMENPTHRIIVKGKLIEE
ncbi:hypothetical protein GCM10023310_50820 [Paenibacillus vulneris]|uniref:Class D sortase n=1 Tax=Paenibacillus vulneris TaxID=1133364 RepID=A0ABW3UN04_9BACL